MINVIVVAVLLLIVGAIVFYLVRARRRGETCIGCPHAKLCGGKCSGHCDGHAACGKETVKENTEDSEKM